MIKFIVLFALIFFGYQNDKDQYFNYNDGFSLMAFPKHKEIPKSSHITLFKWITDNNKRIMRDALTKYINKDTLGKFKSAELGIPSFVIVYFNPQGEIVYMYYVIDKDDVKYLSDKTLYDIYKDLEKQKIDLDWGEIVGDYVTQKVKEPDHLIMVQLFFKYKE